MAPQSKKRKEPPLQSTNLLQFFSPDAAGSKKSKTQSSASQKEVNSQIKKTTTKSTASNQDIIVIDSDSDDGASKTKSGRTRSSIKREDSSEVEFVEGSSKSVFSKQGTGSRNTATSGSHNSDTKDESFDDGDNISFGKPSTLLRPANSLPPPKSESTPDGADEEEEDPSSWNFGAPSSLLSDPTLFKLEHDAFAEELSTTHAEPSRPSLNPIQGSSSESSRYKDSSVPPSAMDINDDDEWGMGDDEMALMEPELDEEEEEEMEDINSPIDMTEPSEPKTTVCPICALRLVGLFATVCIFRNLFSTKTHPLPYRRSTIMLINASTPQRHLPRPSQTFTVSNHLPQTHPKLFSPSPPSKLSTAPPKACPSKSSHPSPNQAEATVMHFPSL